MLKNKTPPLGNQKKDICLIGFENKNTLLFDASQR